MKRATSPVEGLSTCRLLDEAARTEAVFLTKNGAVRYVLMPADDGDQEFAPCETTPSSWLTWKTA